MSGFDTALVAYHIRQLDAEALAALVADLWRARGYETTCDSGTVVARHGTEQLRIRVAPGPDTPATPPDVVVTTDGQTERRRHEHRSRHGRGDGREGTRTTPGRGVRLIDEGTLAEMFGYAIDRPVARALCERHLGGPPGDLAVPPGRRLHRQAEKLLAAVPALAVLVGALAVAVVLGGVAGGPSGDTIPDPPPGDELETVTLGTPDSEGSAAEPTGSSRDGRATNGLPPGVTAAGIADIEALARAHDGAVRNRSHTVWVDWYRPQRMRPNGTLRHRDTDIATDGDRFLIRTSVDQSGDRTRREAIYNDGDAIYATAWNESTERYDSPFQITPEQVTVATPASVRARVVRDYLSTPDTSIAGVVERDGTRLYRIRGQGRPNVSWTVAIIDYEVEALVDSRGLVREVSMRANVSYPQVADNSTIPIGRTISYGRINATTVDPPEWYENHTTRR